MSDNSNIKQLKNLDLSSEYCHNCKLVKCVALCIDKICSNNGPICYNCLYLEHLTHCSNCIPIQKIKIENLETSSFDEYINGYKNFMDKTNGEIQILFNDQKRLLNDLENISTNSISYITSLNLWKSLVSNNDDYVISTDSIKEAIEMKIQKSFEGINLKLAKIFNYNEYKKYVYEHEYQKGVYYIHSDINKPGNLLYSEKLTGDILHFSVNRENILLNAVCICRPVTSLNLKLETTQNYNYVRIMEENNGIFTEIVSKKFQIEIKESVLTNFSDKKSHLLIKFDNPISLKKNKEYSIKVVNYYKGSYYLQTNGVKEGLNDSNIFTIKECSSETRFITDNRNTTNNQYPSPLFQNTEINKKGSSNNSFTTSTDGILEQNNNAQSSLFGNSNSTKSIAQSGLFGNSNSTKSIAQSSLFGNSNSTNTNSFFNSNSTNTSPFFNSNSTKSNNLFGQSLPTNSNKNESVFTSIKRIEYIPIKYPYSGMIAYIEYSFKK